MIFPIIIIDSFGKIYNKENSSSKIKENSKVEICLKFLRESSIKSNM
jgi:hypothetical protein